MQHQSDDQGVASNLDRAESLLDRCEAILSAMVATVNPTPEQAMRILAREYGVEECADINDADQLALFLQRLGPRYLERFRIECERVALMHIRGEQQTPMGFQKGGLVSGPTGPCAHSQCPSCGGSGVNRGTGAACVHNLACHCQRCSFRCDASGYVVGPFKFDSELQPPSATGGRTSESIANAYEVVQSSGHALTAKYGDPHRMYRDEIVRRYG